VQIVVGAIRAQPDAVMPERQMTPSEASNGAPAAAETPPEPVDNGDGVIS
jgi:hypothetical protein